MFASFARKAVSAFSALTLLFVSTLWFTSSISLGAGITVTPNPDPQPNGTVGTQYTLGINATGGVPAGYTYVWTVQDDAGSGLQDNDISNRTTASPSFTPTAAGNYILRVQVSDGAGSDNDAGTAIPVTIDALPSVTINQVAANNATQGQAYTITNVSVTGGLQPYTYVWSVLDDAGSGLQDNDIQNRTTINPSFTPQQPGTYRFGLLATDSANPADSALDTNITIVADAVGGALTAEAGNNQNFDMATTPSVQLNGSATGGTPTPIYLYTWSVNTKPVASVSANLISNVSMANPTFTPDTIGTYVLQLDVDDQSGGATANDTVTMTVTDSSLPAGPLTLTVTPNPSVGAVVATPYTISSVAVTGGTAPYTYIWSVLDDAGSGLQDNDLSNRTTASPSFTPTQPGEYRFGLVATDSANPAATVQNTDIRVVATTTGALTANAGGDQSFNMAVTPSVQLNGGATGGTPTPIYLFAWTVTTSPAGSAPVISNVSMANPTFTPDTAGAYILTLTVDDQSGAATVNDTVTMNVSNTPGTGTGTGGGIPYGAQGGGRCINPAYCNVPWSATDSMALRKKQGVKGITLEKKVNTRRADTAEAAVRVGRTRSTDVTYEVVIGNLTGINVDRIVIEDVFKGGKKVKQSNIRSVRGASYDPHNHEFIIDRTILNGGTYSFSYRATLTAKYTNAMAYNKAVLREVIFPAGVYEKSADARQGLSDPAYIQFGSGSSSDLSFGSGTNIYVPTEVTADKTEVTAGDSINYTVTVRNNTDEALTGVVVNDNYDEGLVAVTDAAGADNNGTDLSWVVGTVEPGETLRFTYTATVREDAAYADTMLESKVRVYTDQYNDEATAFLDIHVAPKYAGFLAGAQRSLPATGLALLPVIFGSLGMAVATRRRKRN
jgi:uncharacterized repeat protein (TIGR01451 family)